MEISFKYQSDYFGNGNLCNEIEVTMYIETYSYQDYEFSIESLYDCTDNIPINMDDISESEWQVINKKAEEVANDRAYESYISKMEYLASQRDN